MISIRIYLVIIILAVITLSSFVAVLRGYQSSMLEADRLFDRQLLETVNLIANIHTENTAENIGMDSNIAFQVWHAGQLIAASSNAPDEAIMTFTPSFDYNNFNGYRWRTIAHYDPKRKYWVLAAERMDLRYTLAESVILETIYPILLSLPIVGLLIWFIVGQGIKPLCKLADELGSKQASDLAPLSMQSPKRELKQIVHSINGLLGRLHTSLQREKQFAADAAHELRTPISALKVQLFNMGEEIPEETFNTRELTLATERLEHVVEQLLDLYRNTPDQFHASLCDVDLDHLVQNVLAEEYRQFEKKHQHIEYSGLSCIISGDEFALKTLLRNLLSNASKYTPEKGSINVSLSRDGGHSLLKVEDSGAGIPSALQQCIFERFYRIGGDQHNSGEPGCGLGLSIVKHIVELHHASIEIDKSRFDTGTAFCVYFPSSMVSRYGAQK